MPLSALSCSKIPAALTAARSFSELLLLGSALATPAVASVATTEAVTARVCQLRLMVPLLKGSWADYHARSERCQRPVRRVRVLTAGLAPHAPLGDDRGRCAGDMRRGGTCFAEGG